MTEFDVSRYVIPTRRDSNHGLSDMVEWLDEYVGEWDKNVYNRTSNIVREGRGWDIRTLKNGKETEDKQQYAVISWHCRIEDEQKATLFALKWIY
jgi:hypothetical protein